MRLEQLLFHELDATGSIEVSTTSSTGPWTKLTLPSTMPVAQALSEWTTLANAALPAVGWDFLTQAGATHVEVVFDCTGGNGWVKLTPCLADLLGFSTATLEAHNTATSDRYPLAVFEGDGFSVGVTAPVDVETGELSEYAGGRASSYHYGRALEVEVSLFIDPDTWAACSESVVLSGHTAMLVVIDEAAAWDEGQLDGSLTVYPLETLEIDREAEDAHLMTRLRCTMGDP